ncbi:sulfite exporter TauE/SafE family protein [Sporichthya polymorpha]|uniref:sulfite exporter TauE/SafE family protein n=1 Tax=Sporichthya polymorpha TaxID=35751 RepID=UPI000364FF9C|nr:sulfite exporter TauE/SafE family protein [Sporichthya polymorpha]
MSALSLFFTGLTTGAIAGGASCAAVQGGLLAGAVGRRRAATADAELVPAAGLSESVARDLPKPLPEATGHRRAAVARRAGLLGEDGALVPLGAFLSAKLVSHTLLGALFGALGAAAQPSPRQRATLLLLAAALMVVFALDMLGVKAVRGLTPRAPEAWTRRVRRSSRSDSAFTPALLGFLTVLLPCGVTLSVWLLAITSGSVIAGAAVMAGFVIGTAPLFALIGYLLRQSSRLWQGRLSIATAVVVLGVAAWTVSSALTLGDWGPDRGSGTISAAESARAVRTLPDGTQVITLAVSSGGYAPSAIAARPGVPTRLELVTDDTGGCTRAFVVASKGIQQVLPETGVTSVDLGVPKEGTLKYTCGMGMYTGRIAFQAVSIAPAAQTGAMAGPTAGRS